MSRANPRAVRSSNAIWLRMEPWQAEALARVINSWLLDRRPFAPRHYVMAADVEAAMLLRNALAHGREGEPLLEKEN